MDNAVLLPPGELISASGTNFHVRRFGDPFKPPLLLETGLTLPSACWGWLAPELAKKWHVIVYDRAGLGWSDERDGLRDAGQVAAELEELWKVLALERRPVLVGHSMGAIFNRALHRRRPDLARAMVWLDPAHPDQLTKSRRMRSFFFLLEFAHLLARGKLPSITVRIVPHLRGLPPSEYTAVRYFLKNPRHLRTCAREARAWNVSADYVRKESLDELPLLVISAQKNSLRNWTNYQRELAEVSSKSKQVTFTDMSHLSMLANEEHARRVADEIHAFVEALG